jgi:hypothetical protein
MNRDTLSGTQLAIVEQCDFIAELLLEKNRQYGDSALNPVRIFSSVDPVEQINVRIDDKLSRIASNQDDDAEDAELDLIGYLVLKRVAMKKATSIQLECSDFRPQRPGQVDASDLETLRKTTVPDLAHLCNRRGGVGGVNT